MRLATILFLTALAIPPTTLVLTNGQRIEIEGPIQQENGRITFRKAGGALYSIPLTEIDAEATRAASNPPTIVRPDGEKKLKVSAEERRRLLAELANNHSGRPASAEQQTMPEVPEREPREPATPKTSSEEWGWRHTARGYEEGVRRAQENLDLLLDRRDQLRSQISGFVSLGYKPTQFTYQTRELLRTEEQIPYAELELRRAQRAWADFREDARKQGILPGWLR